MKINLKTLVAAAMLIFPLSFAGSGCMPHGATAPPEENGSAPVTPPPPLEPEPPEETEPDYAALGVNELGQIMVLMYHEIGEPEGEWCRTPDNFRRDLHTLYDGGYRLLAMNDLIDGHIAVPAGTSPVVLTFDDGCAGQFRLIDRGDEKVIDPDCAIGILEEFHRNRPDFGCSATFYLFYAASPFGRADTVQEKLDYLAEKGYEIGNHTYSHQFPGLRALSPEAAQQELAAQVRQTQEYLPGYRIRSLALPYGSVPAEMTAIIRGSDGGTGYHHEGILLVGANPAPSPFSTAFAPAAIPRVRASEMKTDGVGLYEWMARLAENPGQRYLSDGDPNTVVIPSVLRDQVEETRLGKRNLITYDR